MSIWILLLIIWLALDLLTALLVCSYNFEGVWTYRRTPYFKDVFWGAVEDWLTDALTVFGYGFLIWPLILWWYLTRRRKEGKA